MSDQIIAFLLLGHLLLTVVLSIFAVFLFLRRRLLKTELERSSEELAACNVHARTLQKENRSLNEKNRSLGEEKSNLLNAYETLRNDLAPYRDVSTKVEEAKRTGIAKLSKLRENIRELDRLFASRRTELDAVNKELCIRKTLMHEGADDFDLILEGYSQPQFELEDTPAYVVAIKQIKIEQKDMLRRKAAVFCMRDWQIVDDRRENNKIISNAVKLTARAFNNECDLLVSKVTWKNAESTKDKVSKLAETLNRLNENFRIKISEAYVLLRLREIELVKQERLKREEDRERLRQQQAREREEREAQREYQAEIKRQERIEKEKARKLSELRDRLRIASEEHRNALESEIILVEEEIAEAMRQKERVMAMAEHTRIGHVYVISNEGSFGKNVLKIGLTRRLEPIQRIKELSSASVPFPFEVHAMVFSEDAPELEKKLHSAFSAFRMNTANVRKEFFRITPTQAKQELEKFIPNTPFETIVHSHEYVVSSMQT